MGPSMLVDILYRKNEKTAVRLTRLFDTTVRVSATAKGLDMRSEAGTA